MNMWAERLIGVLLFGLLISLALAAFSHLVPDRAGQFLSVQTRMLDSVRPHLLIVVMLFVCALLITGQWRWAGAGTIGAVAVLASIALDYTARAAPKAANGDLSVLWFNMLETNTIAPDMFADALRTADVDVIVIGESIAARDVPALMAETHPYRLGCEDDRADLCGLMLLSRVPLGTSRIRDLPSGPERFMRVVIERPDHVPVHLIAMHMVKPWFSGFAGTEMEAISAALNVEVTPPTVLVGDFNAAPWSRRMRSLARDFDLRHPSYPIATWPVSAGPLGVPIDHVLVRGGAALAEIAPWGEDLGSNHRGLRAEIALPPR